MAGSGRAPNSSRSPPAQNVGPSPRRCTSAIESSIAGHLQRLDELIAHRGVERVADRGAGERDVQHVAVPLHADPWSRVVRGAGRTATSATRRTQARPGALSTRPTRPAAPRSPIGRRRPAAGWRARSRRAGSPPRSPRWRRGRCRRRTTTSQVGWRASAGSVADARRRRRATTRAAAGASTTGASRSTRTTAGGQTGHGGSLAARAAATSSPRDDGVEAMGRSAGWRAIIVAPCSRSPTP